MKTLKTTISRADSREIAEAAIRRSKSSAHREWEEGQPSLGQSQDLRWNEHGTKGFQKHSNVPIRDRRQNKV